jgi:hypothetical protein
MQHSVYDLEVYARQHRENIQRQAEREQLIATARESGRVRQSPPRLTRLLATFHGWIVRERPAARPDSTAQVAQPVPAPQTPLGHLPLPVKRASAANAYAGMVVIARASSVPVSRHPSGVGES